MKRLITSASVIALMAGSASAAFFSFASDRDDMSWTFTGAGASITDAHDPGDPLVLLVDDQNGILPELEFDVEFNASMTITHVGSIPVGTNWSHNYLLSGTFEFLDATGAPLLTVSLDNALLTALGGQASWYTTATMQGSDLGTNGVTVDYVWHGSALPDYELFPGLQSDPSDFGFDLTVLNTSGILPYMGGGEGVGLDANMLPDQTWYSEASYSGWANPIPTPAGALTLVLGGLVATRRRR